MYTRENPETDSKRQTRRLRLNKVDRILFAVVFLAMILLTVAVVSLYVPARQRSVESYGYDLSNLLVPYDLVAATGRGRYEIRPLSDPQLLTVDEVTELNEVGPGRMLVSSDRVVGVVINDEARAYPLRTMNWHEVINDTLGGVPIAVTYSPLSDSVVVFDRRLGERVLQFRHSALLFNSNLLMQDWQDEDSLHQASLFSQLQFRAVSGPLAGEELRVLPMEVTTWDAWTRKFPQTLAVRGLEEYEQAKLYRKNPYGPYLHTGQLKFPVIPLPSGADRDSSLRMQRVIALMDDEGNWVHRPASDLAGAEGSPVRVDFDGEWPVFEFVESLAQPAVYACNFAWFSVRFHLQSDAASDEE